jgi:ADP-heptose:LPS heptosyltransferase
MEALLGLLSRKPWRVLAGNLNLVQITAVIKHSSAHFCGDTGTLHLALITQTPTVAWFWPNPSIDIWVPKDKKHQTIVGRNDPARQYLYGIDNEAVIRAAKMITTSGTP